MEIMYQSCAGLDVHKKSVVVCRITPKAEGGWAKDIQTFGTFTEDLLTLLDWLRAGNVTHIAMESTGVYWKPRWKCCWSTPSYQICAGTQNRC